MKASIDLQNVNVKFSFKDSAVNGLRRKLINSIKFSNTHVEYSHRLDVHALKNINLHIEEGARIGLIGENGSGKSTLLKVLAGVLYPTSGDIDIVGNVNAIFDPSLGMDPEASGLENIRIRCMLMRTPSQGMEKLIEQIADFSELGDALHRPLKSYSAGMSVRLAFSIATTVEPEILVMDEWLSAGDARFVSKALNRMESLVKHSRILVIASHSEDILSNWCSKLIWFDQGRIIAEGSPQNILIDYRNLTKNKL
jgi:ABC-type polysaccharide/polyol phosphate transport system ATPase subunit